MYRCILYSSQKVLSGTFGWKEPNFMGDFTYSEEANFRHMWTREMFLILLEHKRQNTS